MTELRAPSSWRRPGMRILPEYMKVLGQMSDLFSSVFFFKFQGSPRVFLGAKAQRDMMLVSWVPPCGAKQQNDLGQKKPPMEVVERRELSCVWV